MATLKDEDDSWKASGIKRRDFRHSHDGPEVMTRGKKKSTLKNCKGKKGKEHKWVTKPWKPNVAYGYYLIDKCENCGKEINWRWNDKFKRPSWWR